MCMTLSRDSLLAEGINDQKNIYFTFTYIKKKKHFYCLRITVWWNLSYSFNALLLSNFLNLWETVGESFLYTLGKSTFNFVLNDFQSKWNCIIVYKLIWSNLLLLMYFRVEAIMLTTQRPNKDCGYFYFLQTKVHLKIDFRKSLILKFPFSLHATSWYCRFGVGGGSLAWRVNFQIVTF